MKNVLVRVLVIVVKMSLVVKVNVIVRIVLVARMILVVNKMSYKGFTFITYISLLSILVLTTAISFNELNKSPVIYSISFAKALN